MSWRGLSAIVIGSMLTFGCSQSDPGITTAVKAKLAADDQVKSYRIDVDTKDRVVTLSGAVDTPGARERAVQIARNTNGVTNVVDQLIVSPGATPTTGVDDAVQGKAKEKSAEARDKAGEVAADAKNATSDAMVTAAVKSKFLADTSVSGLRIDVDTADGVVTLTGTVPSKAEIDRAITVAKGTDGVKRVVNKLKVGK
jgi:hyperosmotically inducible periplasmic protein